MIYNYIKTIVCISLLGIAINSKAQTAFSETFGTGVAWPVGWTYSDGDWQVDDGTGVPACTVVGSSSVGLMVGADGGAGVQRSISRPFSTLAYSSMTLAWNGYRSTGAPTLTLEIRYNNSNLTGAVGSSGWTVISFTDVTTDDAWHSLAVNLPVAAEGQTSVYIRWSYTTANGGAFISFDDVTVTGISTPIFYWDGVGAINQLSSWSDVIGGGGISPGSFTSNDQFFNMLPVGVVSSATLSGAWTIGGNNTVLNIGDGTSPFSFVINSTMTFAAGASPVTRMIVFNTSTVVLQSTSSATISSTNVNLNTGSTVDFAQSSPVTLWGGPFSNLSISGGADKSQNGNTVVNGILNLNSSSLVMSNSAIQGFTLNGTIAGAGTIKTGNSKLIIGGTGTFGTVTFGTGSTVRTVNQFTFNRTSSGLLTLGSDLTVSGASNLSNGQINLNNKKLTLNGITTFPNLISNGSFIGSTTSSLTIGGSGAVTNNLFFDQTSASTRAMKDVTLNRSGVTVTLGNALEVWGSLTPSVGTIASGGNLTLKNDATNKGRIGALAAGGDITGNVNVETFLPGGITGWANLCSPGVSGLTMASWNTSIPMTCSACPNASVGGVAFESVYSYDETLGAGTASNAAHYIGLTSGLSDAINVKKGYWVYLGNGNLNTTNITPVLTGPVNKNNSIGGISLSLTGGVSSENGWNLISNPFPSPISLNSMFAGNTSNIDNTIQIWNADLNGGSGDWAFYTLGGATDAIPMGQGIMVRALTAVNLTASESWKTTSTVSVQRPIGNFDVNSLFKLNLTGGGGGKVFDTYSYFDFQPSYIAGFDNGRDVYAIDNASGNTVAQIFSKVNTDKYAVAALPPPALNSNFIIPIHIPTGYSGVYSINPVNMNTLPVGVCVQLVDLTTNVIHDLYTGAYTTTILANDGSAARFNLKVSDCGQAVTNPVAIKEVEKTNSSILIDKDAAGIFVKLNFDQATKATISVTNILGQKIMEYKNVTAKETIYLDLVEKNQLIFVTVSTETSKVTKKFVN